MVAFILFAGLLQAFNVMIGHAGDQNSYSSLPLSSSSLSPPPPAPPPPTHVTLEELLQNASIPRDYTFGRRSNENWDTDRQLWLAAHPDKKNYSNRGTPRLCMLTGSQPQPCAGSKGDYLLLKSFKNKVDYCMLHDVQIFYNLAVLDKNMDGFWSKLPLIRASMEAHPETEWFWWVDSDAVITDMFFELPPQGGPHRKTSSRLCTSPKGSRG